MVHFGRVRPEPGEPVQFRGGSKYVWAQSDFDETGSIAAEDVRGARYVYTSVESESRQVLLMAAKRHRIAYLNGKPRAGNIYGYDYFSVPVLMHAGTNDVLLQVGRGAPQLEFVKPLKSVFVHRGDQTLPHLIRGQATDTWGAVLIINSTERAIEGLKLTSAGRSLSETTTDIPAIPPISIRKVGFKLQGPAPERVREYDGTLRLHSDSKSTYDEIPFILQAKNPDDSHKRTFVSEVDGSVQYFALRPAVPLSKDDPLPAIVLSCHGASVEAIGQSNAYSPKSWLHLIAPTNRRPYGFDWEDFGRLDAMEVLGIAKGMLPHDPARIYLTGHSMGGHGTWHLGVTYPDEFAAIGPSAGWISRRTYGRRSADQQRQTAVDLLINRTANTGDTIGLSDNLRNFGVYVLHGADDDNVPASQSRRMADLLGAGHHDWVYHEETGKKHWWSNVFDDGGATCMDWPHMFDLFARHARPPVQAVRRVEFVTANPAVSSRCYWLSIEGQLKQHEFSRVTIDTWPNKRRFVGTTENVAVLRLETAHLRSGGKIAIELDGQRLEADPAAYLWLRRNNDAWVSINRPPPSHKGAHRYGSIKDELRHRFLLVYGTQGTAAETDWAFAKARYDAETFWYRGNASVDVIPDTEFDSNGTKDRTVVLYGNRDTHASWDDLLSSSPVQVTGGEIQIAQRRLEGDDLLVLFIRPRADSDTASVIVVAGTGVRGMRAADKQSFFVPFLRYPDCTIVKAPNSLGGGGAMMSGFFGLDWSVENGEFAWIE